MINGHTLCTDKSAHYVWFVWKHWNGTTFSLKRCFLHKFFCFQSLSNKKLYYLQNAWIIVIKCTLEKFTAWGRNITSIATGQKSQGSDYKTMQRSTNNHVQCSVFSVQCSNRLPHIKWQKLISWKNDYEIFHFVSGVSVRGLTFSDFMIRKCDEVFTTFAIWAFANTRQTKDHP